MDPTQAAAITSEGMEALVRSTSEIMYTDSTRTCLKIHISSDGERREHQNLQDIIPIL